MRLKQMREKNPEDVPYVGGGFWSQTFLGIGTKQYANLAKGNLSIRRAPPRISVLGVTTRLKLPWEDISD